MKILTEADVRTGFFVKHQKKFGVDANTIVTGEAKAFMEKYGLELSTSGEETIKQKVAAPAKPEHMTHLSGLELVAKNDDRILFRGKLDSTEAIILKDAIQADKYGNHELRDYLLEALELLRRVMAAVVKNQPLGDWTFMGLTSAELREQSHHPEKYFGVSHSVPKIEDGFAAVGLNLLRTQVRELELSFAKAYITGVTVLRPDIAELLNRLSSGIYILYCRVLSGELCSCSVEGKASSSGEIPIEVSARHVHLSKEDVERLFGRGHRLTKKRDLSQTGEFLCEERVTIRGKKGELVNIAVLGPERAETQVEVSMSDSRVLGIKPPLRPSGNLTGASDCTIISSQAEIMAAGSVIVAKNHIHMTPEEAQAMKLQNGQLVDIQLKGERPLIFCDVVVRVKPSFRKFMHIDFDEANAAMIDGQAIGMIVRKGRS